MTQYIETCRDCGRVTHNGINDGKHRNVRRDWLCFDCEDTTVAGVYGADNPWVKWLAEHAPAELKKSPRELRQRQGVPATPTPGIPGSFIE